MWISLANLVLNQCRESMPVSFHAGTVHMRIASRDRQAFEIRVLLVYSRNRPVLRGLIKAGKFSVCGVVVHQALWKWSARVPPSRASSVRSCSASSISDRMEYFLGHIRCVRFRHVLTRRSKHPYRARGWFIVPSVEGMCFHRYTWHRPIVSQ